ncbi:MAG: hypothetical protein IJW29_10070 [Clostridia bacterium]|nr:hypothetical protein [Clostridia bacterium]MBQ9785836.1 hypothetical protein [Clostridia bacterium]
MKKIISVLLLLATLALSCSMLTSCAAPKVEEIYDRVVYLIEGSYEVNTMLYGDGLPVYRADSEYAAIKHIYFDFANTGTYEYVTEQAKCFTFDMIKAKARKVYSEACLEALFEYCFTGYATNDGSGNMVIDRARYLEDNSWIYQSTAENNFACEMRFYDYSTMKVHSLGRRDACSVTMDSWLVSNPDKIENVEIYLVLQDGEWFLDSVTGLA